MKSGLVWIFCIAAMFSSLANGQALPRGKFGIVRLDPTMDELVSPKAKLEVLKEDYFGFAEAPVWVNEGSSGYLLFSDIPANVIYKWTPDGKLSIFLERSGFTGTDNSQVGAEMPNGRLMVILVGSNGLALDQQGRLIICAEGDRSVVRMEKDGTQTTLADRYEGKRLNSPNDVIVKSNGTIYFTDQNSGLRGRDSNPTKELPFHGVFMVKDGQLRLLAKDPLGVNPNGIGLSPDEKHLYVNGSTPEGKKLLLRFEVQPDDTAANGKVFFDLSEDKAFGITDGLRVDSKGNIWESGPGGIWVFSPDGKHLGTIQTPEPVTNLIFGDRDGKGLYITTRRSLYRIRVKSTGMGTGAGS